ncbi:RDD family protein [Candidatus Halobeggiatoa sp. HSG11]|nr:RDD family protein [Candidatus Halobeggiatoa sp. HSG11]
MITFLTEYAGFGRRTLALALDLTWLYPLLIFLLYLSYLGDPVVLAEIKELNYTPESEWRTALIFYALPALITIWFWIKLAATPGKLLLDCEIVDAKTGKPINLKQSILRYIGYIISTLPFFLGFFWMLIDKRNQTWHDKIAGTIVIIHDESQVPLYKLIEGY